VSRGGVEADDSVREKDERKKVMFGLRGRE
jgi:hypothetical protein